MPKAFRSISGKEMIKRLTKIGFIEVSQKGSHVKLKKKAANQTIIIIVPNHRELSPGVLSNIIKTANLSLESFDKLK